MDDAKNMKAELIKYTALVMLLACAYSYGSFIADSDSSSWLHQAGTAVSDAIGFVAEEQPHVK